MWTWILIAAVFIVYAITASLDWWISAVGVQTGKAVEGNSLVVKIFGTDKPSAKDYVLYGVGEAFVLSIPALFELVTGNPYAALISAGPYTAMIVKHLQGYKAWRKYGVSI